MVPLDPVQPLIRPARVGEHVVLTELAFRSAQLVWGYPDEFMAWEPEAIAVTPGHVLNAITNVLEVAGEVLGFYVLSGLAPEVEMSRLMVEPDAVGNGWGRALWNHAVSTARNLGATVMTLDADPNAEAFYVRMGAVTVGEHDWEPPMMPGWRVKKMRYRP